MILDGKKVREKLLSEYRNEIESNKLDITLAIIYIGHNDASELYIKNKIKYCKEVGIQTRLITFNDDISDNEVISMIKELNNNDKITGIIVQSPIPNHLDFDKIVQNIDPNKDVDGFTKENWYKLSHDIDSLRPCTSKGIMKLLNEYNIDVTSKNVCIIGRGNLVGKPMLFEMLNHNASVDICHSKTNNLKEHTLNADIIVCACGKPHLLTSDMVKDGTIVIDVGITVIDGKIIGDVDYDNLVNKCSYITPNPGGIGPMTIAMIIDNLIKASKR